jgi:hypothetical protein
VGEGEDGPGGVTRQPRFVGEEAVASRPSFVGEEA